MAKLHYDRRVLAFHGTDKKTAQNLLKGAPFSQSQNDHDWLGRGIYFWEDGPDRAAKWARDKHDKRGAIVGAIIQLGNCYDLMDTRNTADLRRGANAFLEVAAAAEAAIPKNVRGGHYLDCAILNWWLDRLGEQGNVYQTVRRGFEEGEPVSPGMAITMASHVQIAVRDPSCVLGVFRTTVADAQMLIRPDRSS
jgi:hypothetical protein